jgi:DNA polymerase III delta subunit
MVISLTGDSFGWQAELNRLIGDFVAEYGDLALERLDGEEADFSRLQAALTGLPFLTAKKLVVLRAPSQNKQFAEQIEQLLANIAATNDVILIEPKLDKRLSYYKILKKQTDFRDFSNLDINGLAHWLSDQAKKQQGSLSSADARYLVERVGANQQLLFNELEKLLLYDPKISRANIDLLTEATPQSTIFQLLEAAFSGNNKKMLQLYAEQRALKVEPPQIIAMLTWQLHILAIIKTSGDRSAEQIAKQARLSPYVVRKSQSIARHLTLVELKKLMSDLLSIDVKSKRTNLDADEALQTYLLKLASA